MVNKRLKRFLDENGIKYVSIEHSQAFTASEVAVSAHVAGRDFAKTVVVRIDGNPAMVVLPATRRLLLHELKEMIGSEDVKLASEAQLRALFPDCEIGAMAPFGNLYAMDVHIVASLTQEREIAFNAGTHTDIVKMAYEDYERLVHPKVIDLVTT